MKYRVIPGTDRKVSALGMGCMRLPTLAEEGNPIDFPKAIELVRHAIDSGVTYVDTAYGYHNETSERLVGEALKDGYRERVTLATKLPVWKVEKYEDMEALLDEQLGKLQVGHVDVYLLHALDGDRFDKMMELGVLKFLDEMLKKGKIRYPGFSFHDDAKAFRKIVDAYDWKVCQVQMNVLDEFNQATLEGVRYAASKGIGVIVMEPLRGGALTKTMPAEIKAIYDAAPVQRTAADWAFRWLIDKPQFITILSGMNTMEQLDENLQIFDRADVGCLTEADAELLTNVRLAYEKRIRVGCTGCEYCMPCPQGINIPRIFRGYDQASMFDSFEAFFARYKKDNAENPCVSCGACVAACPQHFKTPIYEMLANIYEESKQY